MSAARFSRTVAMTVGYSLTVRDLTTFLAEVRAAGMDMETAKITWNADKGDQRDPAQLTLTAVPGGAA